MSTVEQSSRIVGWTLALERMTALDGAVKAVEPVAQTLFSSGGKGAVLRGEWLGHAVHPLLTDVVLGTWTSATVLDLVGGAGSASSAQKLIGTGLLAAGPTAWTGWAEWSAASPRDKRVGLVHAVTNAAVIGAYAASWVLRRQGRHASGKRLALAGAGLSAVGAHLGGHLALVE